MFFIKRNSVGECETERELQEYYDQHIWEVPEGCRACGGPYPSCTDSCPMFDED